MPEASNANEGGNNAAASNASANNGTGDSTNSGANNSAANNTAANSGDNKAAAGGDGKGGAGDGKGGDAAAAAAAAAAGGGDGKKTILEGGGADKNVATPAEWPADWRVKMAGDDKKLLAQLERFPSPVDLAKKIREQDAIIAAGKHKAALPKDATAEQIAAYRKENGIPESVDKYDLTLPDGLVIGEADKPIVNNMLGTMHKHNLSNDVVKDIMASYYQQEKAFLQERDVAIEKNKTVQDDALHKEWGNEYRANLNIINSLTKTFSAETRNSLAGALDSEGFPLLNNKGFLKDLAVMARTINPIDTVVSGNGGNQMSSVEDEIKAIEKRMGGADPTYYKDEAAQKRLRQLYEWRDTNKKAG